MQKKKVHNFTVIIEQDEDGYYVGYVPSIRGCHSQGKTLDDLLESGKVTIGKDVFIGRGADILERANITHSDVEKYARVGNGAKIDAPKEHLGKKVYVLIRK